MIDLIQTVFHKVYKLLLTLQTEDSRRSTVLNVTESCDTSPKNCTKNFPYSSLENMRLFFKYHHEIKIQDLQHFSQPLRRSQSLPHA